MWEWLWGSGDLERYGYKVFRRFGVGEGEHAWSGETTKESSGRR
jgi:hypothetical protein